MAQGVMICGSYISRSVASNRLVLSFVIMIASFILMGKSHSWNCDYYHQDQDHFDEHCYRREIAMFTSGITLFVWGGIMMMLASTILCMTGSSDRVIVRTRYVRQRPQGPQEVPAADSSSQQQRQMQPVSQQHMQLQQISQ